MRLSAVASMSLLSLAVSLTTYSANAQIMPYGMGFERSTQAESVDTGSYHIERRSRFVNDAGEEVDQSVTITRDDRELAALRADRITIVRPDGSAVALAEAPVDITGDGVPELLVHTRTGGRNCCHGLVIYSLGPRFAKLLDLGDSPDEIRLTDLNRDGRYEIVGHDLIFAGYWNDEAESPIGLVALAFGPTGLQPDPALTRQATDAAMRAAPRRSGLGYHLQILLDLVYGNRVADAQAYASANWDTLSRGTSLSLFPNAQAMLADLTCRLPQSAYAAVLPRPTAACPPPGKTPYQRWLDHEKN